MAIQVLKNLKTHFKFTNLSGSYSFHVKMQAKANTNETDSSEFLMFKEVILYYTPCSVTELN